MMWSSSAHFEPLFVRKANSGLLVESRRRFLPKHLDISKGAPSSPEAPNATLGSVPCTQFFSPLEAASSGSGGLGLKVLCSY